MTYRGQDSQSALDITDFVERIEITDTGTGTTRTMVFRLNGQDGQFITRANQLGTNADTPLVEAFDKIEIVIIDRDGRLFNEVFDVNMIKPIQNAQQGVVLEVECLGLEYYLMKNNFTKQFRYESGFNVARDIIDFYNDSIPKTNTLNPIVSGHTSDSQDGGSNDLPKTTANHYMFGVTELPHYEALTQTVDQMGSSVAAGGAGNFFEHHFVTNNLTKTDIIFEGFESGNPPAQQTDPANDDFSFDPSKAVIIDDSVSVNPGEEEGGIEALVANQVGVWGFDGKGTLPFENNQFSDELEAWQFSAEYINDEFYPKDSLIQQPGILDTDGDFIHFRAGADTTAIPPNAPWVQEFFTDFVSVPQYSKWTNALANAWKNSCANANGPQGSDLGTPLATSTFEQLCAWDGNQVIIDGEFQRTYVDVREVNPANIANQFLRNGQVYRGFRVLVDTELGPAQGAFVGFENQVVQWNGNEWRQFRILVNDNLCGVDFERQLGTNDGGKVYQLIAGVWTDIAGSLILFPDGQSNDCYHPIWAMYNSQGFFNHNNGVGGNYGQVSAVTHEFRYERGDNFTLSTNANYYRAGAWANFRVPFPFSSFNSQSIGSLYGNNDDKREPATFDQFNMHLTPSGFVGFNNTEGMNLGTLNAITFYTKFEWRNQADGSGSLIALGNLPCRCFMYDTNDTVVTQDFTIPFNNLWEPVSLPFSEFKIYRARAPWSIGDIGQNVFLQGIEITDVFRYENIKKIGFQWMGPYDEQGRYALWKNFGVMFQSLTDFFAQVATNVTDFNIKWSFDYFGFSKPLLSLTDPIESGRLLQTQFFDEPLIDNKFQLDQVAAANLDITQFQYREYETVTEGTFDIPFGYSFFLKNEDLIREEDLAGTPNTIKLVNKKTVYTIDKPPTGPGGFLRSILGVKIIES